MLDKRMLKDMPHGTIFAKGEAKDEPGKLFRSGNSETLRWVAVRGGGLLDWAVYSVGENSAWNNEGIAQHGDKVRFGENIRFCVPCDDEALQEYRR